MLLAIEDWCVWVDLGDALTRDDTETLDSIDRMERFKHPLTSFTYKVVRLPTEWLRSLVPLTGPFSKRQTWQHPGSCYYEL